MCLQYSNHFFHVILTSLWRKDCFSHFKDPVYCIVWYQGQQRPQYRQFPKLIMPLSLPRVVFFFCISHWFSWPWFLFPFPIHTAGSLSHLVSADGNADDWETAKLLSLGKGTAGRGNFCEWGTENEGFRKRWLGSAASRRATLRKR